MAPCAGSRCNELGFIQAFSVNCVVKSRLLASGTCTKSFTPSKLNALLTFPVIMVVPFSNVPSFPFKISAASASPGHQLTNPEGDVLEPKLALVSRGNSQQRCCDHSCCLNNKAQRLWPFVRLSQAPSLSHPPWDR